jgi:large subunit ribosomal protein L4
MILDKFFTNLKKKNSIGFIHKIYLTFLKKKKKYLASTKTKSEVRGGGAKPWRQKGTGQARAGSKRSPLWVGGGVIFGPKPHIKKNKINKKENKLAIFSALYLKKNNISIINSEILNNISIFKTKILFKILKENKFNQNEKTLLILPEFNKYIWLMARNLKNLTITTIETVNIENLICAKKIFILSSVLKKIKELYENKK